MDLLDRTLSALDWSAVLQALSTHARTMRGAAAAGVPRFCETLDEVRETYAAVVELRELEAVGERVPVGAVTDIAALLERTERGLTLEGAELQAVASCLDALVHLRTWVEEREAEIPRLRLLSMPIEVDGELHGVLSRSFDTGSPPELGGLSGREYPELARLHAKVESLRSRIRSTLDTLVKTTLGDALQDQYITQRDGRFVLPVRADRRRGLGIVHGRSQSGETVYVEPAAVVELHNEMDEAAHELHREVGRILGVLSRMVGRFAAPLAIALDAAEAIDLVVARVGLMRALTAVVPSVGDDGVIALRAARHPVLALRGVDVVPNDLGLDGRCQGLVLSGPNTGGKTIALKTLGLAALMVRAGIPVPCTEGSRVDFFSPVVADVGDWQSVEGDLSTFSGHVAVLRAVLDAVRPGRDAHALVLLDELGMGTDPAQGAALARAVLEALVDRGARVAVTTHYTELKALAAVDPRFEVAAVAIEDGQPTYQLLVGTAGESHALAIAAGLDLDPAVLARARALLGSSTREVSDLVQKLEEERSGLARRRRELDAEAEGLAERLAAMQRREDRLEEQRRTLEDKLSARFQARMKAREQELKKTIALLQARPDLRTAGRALADVRKAMADAEVSRPEKPAAPPPKELKPGDSVVVRSLGKKGRVERLLKGDQVSVRVGALTMKLRRTDLEGTRGERFADVAPRKPKKSAPPPSTAERGRVGGLRIDANTLDLRGQRVDDALDLIDRFLADLAAQGFDTGWILHGHGTGALKTAVRRMLPRRTEVRRWRPADAGEGGDAFTVVELD